MLDFPLTKFIARLRSMTPEELRAANPRRAARTFGIRIDWARHYIAEQQGLRGVSADPDPMTPDAVRRAPWPEDARQEGLFE